MYKFKSTDSANRFEWSHLGDVQLGRKNLGPEMPVAIYRLLQFTLREVLSREYGVEKASELLRNAGFVAGQLFCRQLLNCQAGFDAFVASLQKTLKDQKIGILRIEKADLVNMEFYLTVEEDLDCSGLPITDESVCEYDEGFIAGLMHEYTGKTYRAVEIDCWATGARVCRFKVNEVRSDEGEARP